MHCFVICFSSTSLQYNNSNYILYLSYRIMTKYKKQVEVSIPEAHDLGFCPINHTSSFPFTIFNPNSKPVTYQFKFTQFAIVPSKGVLMPNSVANFKIEFKPAVATVIVGTVVLEIQGQAPKVYKLSAVGKYPYIAVKQTNINFQDILVTKPVSQQLLLKNSSEVEAVFNIVSQQSEFPDNFYTIQPSSGVIPPKMNFGVKVNYLPRFGDHIDINKFKLICESGNQIQLNCKGTSKRFAVSLSSESINFGQIKLDTYSSKTLTIANTSQVQTQFQFFTQAGNIFNFSQNKGIIPKQSSKKIIIEFHPRNTIAYYERVYCLVRNHILLYVDLIGTCYDLLIKPIPLLQSHIDVFRKRVIEGRISEIQLKYVENNALLRMTKRKELGEDYNSASQENFYQTANLISEHPFTLHKQLFLEGRNNELIELSEDCLQFGFCDVMTLSGQKQLIVTNKMQCKLSLYWVNQKRENLNGEFMSVFQVFPESATLKPNVPTKFNITFRPLKSNSFFFQNLQFFALKHNQKISKKTLEDFEYKQIKSKPENTLLKNVKLNQTIQTKIKQELEITEVFPTLSGVIRCSGHSFSQSTMPYLPIVKVNPPKGVIFKPCLINDSTYQTARLSNPSDTPIYFKIGAETSKAFRFYPKIGLIQPKSFCIIAIQFTPRQYRLYKSTLNIILNDMPGSSNLRIPLLGICTPPEIRLQDEGKIFFAPTSVGVYSKKSFAIENLSKTRSTYKINVPEKYQNLIYFQPPQRQLLPNQKFQAQVYFTPQSKKKYKLKIPIQVTEIEPLFDLEVGYYHPGSGAVKKDPKQRAKRQFQVQVIGEGSDGNIKLSEEEINFGAVKITENKKIIVKLCNTSECAFFVDVSLKNADPENKIVENQIINAFKLDFKNGSIPGNSQIDLGITFAPIQIANFDLKLVVHAKEKIAKKIPLKTKGLEPVIKCQMRVRAAGNYPQLEIIDIRNDTLSVAALWENFQITQINQALNTNLTPDQKLFLGIQNLTFSQTKNLQTRLKNYEWNLGYVSAKSKDKPRKVIITVKNFGGTALDYVFKFPSDNKIQQELWADPGEPTEQQAYEKAILDKNIFQIKPKVGHLQSGEVKDIQLIYSPAALDFTKSVGNSSEIHMLKVVFQIKNGKSLVFNLKGTTLGPNEGLLTIKKTFYELPFTPIGLLTPLRFPIEITNVGSIKVTYKSEIGYQQNHAQDVFKIENPSGFLVSGQSTYLYCLYKPLVRKKYSFKVNIEVYDFTKLIQKLEIFFVGDARQSLTDNQKQNNRSIPRQRTSVSQVGSKVFFSIQDLDFGKMKANSTKYRMIIMYNMSKEKSLNFDFNSQNSNSKMGLTCGDKFIIQPSVGTLQPNSFLEIKLTLTSISHPSTYEGEIACPVTWAQSSYSNQDNDATLKDKALKDKKQTLFLRISKQADLTTFVQGKQLVKPSSSDKKSVIQSIFCSIATNVLSDPTLITEIKNLQSQKLTILDHLNNQTPVWLGVQPSKQKQKSEDKKDYSKHENLFLNEQFKQITQLIMQNTFFNIVQETTHKQNDFLRVAKKFISSNQGN